MSSVKENQSVRNACALLEVVAEVQPVGVSDLARRTGIDKSAAHRLAITLHRAGWLHQDAQGRWRISPSLPGRLANAGTESLTETVRPSLRAMRDATGETAMLVAFERQRLVVLDVVDSPHALRITAPVGSELPARNSSALRALASVAPPAQLEQLLRAGANVDEAERAEIRARGYAINDREITADTSVVGAPVIVDSIPVAAIIVCAPTSRVELTEMHHHGTLLAATARELSF